MNTLLASAVSILFINGKPTFINGGRILTRNPPDCIILDRKMFDTFSLTKKFFSKALQRLEAYITVNSKLCGKLVSLVPIMFDDNLRVMSVAFFVADFNLLSCQSESFTFTL